jgi:hypothetical protein
VPYRPAQKLIPFTGLVMLLASAASFAEISLFQDNNYQGKEFRTRDELRNLKSVGINDQASSVIIDRGRWLVCTDADFGGRCITLEAGRYAALGAMGLNDQISSIRPDSGRDNGRDAVVLFQDDGFKGESLPVSINESDLKSRGFNDRASSVVISYGRWEICSDSDFRGRCETLDPGRYSSLRAMGLNDAVSSVRRVGRGSGGWSGSNPGGGQPQVVIGRNGVGEVIFNQNRCVVYYKDGRRTSNAPSCSGSQIDRADDAMERYRRERGL